MRHVQSPDYTSHSCCRSLDHFNFLPMLRAKIGSAMRYPNFPIFAKQKRREKKRECTLLFELEASFIHGIGLHRILLFR